MRVRIGVGAVAVSVVVAGCGVAGGTSGVTVTPSAGAEPSSASRDDVSALDEYADELGLVMIRSRGPEPETYARRVDGPGPDVETLVAGTAEEGAAEVVLRLRKERQDCDWLGGSCQPYEISACYHWVFDDSMDDHEGQRLDECPDVAALDLGPPPVEPHLPDDLVDRLTKGLSSRGLSAKGGSSEGGSSGPRSSEVAVSEAALLQEVRALYRRAVQAAVAEPDVEPEHLLSVEEALAQDSVATVGDSIGVAVGVGRECVMVRVASGDLDVWVPDRMSLMPGEVGCHVSGQLATIGQ